MEVAEREERIKLDEKDDIIGESKQYSSPGRAIGSR